MDLPPLPDELAARRAAIADARLAPEPALVAALAEEAAHIPAGAAGAEAASLVATLRGESAPG